MVRASLKYQIRSQRRVSKVRQGIRLDNKAKEARREKEEALKNGIKLNKKGTKAAKKEKARKESEWKVVGAKKQKKQKQPSTDVDMTGCESPLASLPPRPEKSEELKQFLARDDPLADKAPAQVLPSWGHFED
eukprot:TRINITY_DN18610_c0_g1_i1.p1 TRINITY_DN18610_c0_g1~~TRINITY_DN18610_c0_g1_i1.p1  ORF type:complete len:150 (+),score=33.21 TRINITY_DN18610_c0_g1_i1:54-452(+)